MITLSCANEACRKPVVRSLRRMRDKAKSGLYKRVFCSHRCQGEWVRAHPDAPNYQNRNMGERRWRCAHCGVIEMRMARAARRKLCDPCLARMKGGNNAVVQAETDK